MSTEEPLVGRLAPSPTGLIHLGHARTFLLAWWSVRSRGGRVVLRIEDLDGDRCSPEMVDAAKRDLEWLGLDWDGAARLQSTGIERMAAELAELEARGLVYPCVCTRGEVRQAQSAPQAGDAEPRYPGTCRGRFASREQAAQRSGRTPSLRFIVPEGPVTVRDELRGEVVFDVAASVGDFVVARRDGAPAYQLAVVSDDAYDGVTEVLRGDDLLPSAARQRLLQRALALPSPAYVHLPLVLDETGRRLAKRERDLGLYDLASAGADPRAVVAWAAQSAGMRVPERLTAREATAAFARDRLPREPVRLDRDTLEHLRQAR